MALPAHLNTREFLKFSEVSGEVAVNTKVVSGLLPISYDYVAVTYPTSTTEQYVFKSGGSGGTTLATIVLTYTDSTKVSLSTVAKT